MITLHILQYLIENGLLSSMNGDAFYEKMPLDKFGASIYSVGDDIYLSPSRSAQLFEIEYRHATDTRVAVDRLEKIAMALRQAHPCTLPVVPNVSNRKYTRCQFSNISNVQNLGEDGNGHVIFKIMGRVTYSRQ